MARGSIPAREPVGDPFDGVVLRTGDKTGLALRPQQQAEVHYSGSMIVRYGVRFLGKLHQSIVPGLVVLDYGDMLTGEAAWDFLIKRSNLHPRAEIIGYRDDGSEDMVFLRTLDFAVAPAVLLYNDASTPSPFAQVSALIAAEDELETFPPRVREYLPRFSSAAEWQMETMND
ncbi:MAG: hypothetical protein JNJ61_20395 [Anaerolineae bacterium]|nr:hypothetical protein [Anaerolineae bacterium]